MHVYFFPLTNEKVKVTQKLLIQGSHLYRANSRGNAPPPKKKKVYRHWLKRRVGGIPFVEYAYGRKVIKK